MTPLAETFDLAMRSHQAGEFRQAEQLYRQILEVDPQHVDALHLLGLLAHQVGRSDLAIEYIREALRLQPNFADAYNNLGEALRREGRLGEAVASYEQALRLQPTNALAHNNLGIALRGQGKLSEAAACFRQAVRVQPSYANGHNNLGNILRELGNLDEAAAAYEQALRLQPDNAQTHNNLGAVLGELGNLEESAAHYQQAITLKPDFAEARSNLGDILRQQEKFADAVASLRQALALKPDFADAHNNLGLVWQGQDQLEEAAACFQQALRLRPDFANACNNLGNNLRDLGKAEEAAASYQQALRWQPEYAMAHYNLGMVWLLLGNFPGGWAEYEWRVQCKQREAPPFHQPAWDGAALHGRTILLLGEQGSGDTLQFVRYAALVQERGGRVLVACYPALARLLAACPGIDMLLPHGTPLPAFDVYAPLMSLPRLCGTTLATIPARIPYLEAEPERRDFWRNRLAGVPGFTVGICWQGNPDHRRDRQRSVRLEQFAPLANVPGIRLISLQKGAGSEQLAELGTRFLVTELPEGAAEPAAAWADTAALLKALDLVVTVDTAVAHLAGALGVPVWMALPFAPDWRWLLERADSPWYPTMRLFRQTGPGRWHEVFASMARELEKLVAQTGEPGT